MSKIVTNTCVIHDTYKVYYDYNKLPPCKTLNSMGNFYRSSSYHNKTHKYMENYLKNNPIPKVGKVIRDESFFTTLTITKVIYNYKRTDMEQAMYELRLLLSEGNDLREKKEEDIRNSSKDKNYKKKVSEKDFENLEKKENALSKEFKRLEKEKWKDKEYKSFH